MVIFESLKDSGIYGHLSGEHCPTCTFRARQGRREARFCSKEIAMELLEMTFGAVRI